VFLLGKEHNIKGAPSNFPTFPVSLQNPIYSTAPFIFSFLYRNENFPGPDTVSRIIWQKAYQIFVHIKQFFKFLKYVPLPHKAGTKQAGNKMKKIFISLTSLLILVALQACRTGSDQPESNTDNSAMLNETTISPDSFVSGFDTIALPYSISGSTVEGNKGIPSDRISRFFEGRRFKPTFGEERDLPDLAENEEEAQFYQAGAFHGPGYTAVIIRKQIGKDNYYYLATFAGENYVDGLCIAFAEGDKNDRTERRAAINDDYSIQIMQSNIMNGQVSDEAETMIYVIGTDGSITKLKTYHPGT
jgi:hypothetical protein